MEMPAFGWHCLILLLVERAIRVALLRLLYYEAEPLRGNPLRCIENLRVLIVFCSGPFWYTCHNPFLSEWQS
jgi:hypothetical protein